MKLLVIIIFVFLYGTNHGQNLQLDKETVERAIRFAQRTIIADGHIDFPYRMGKQKALEKGQYLSKVFDNPNGHFDYRRARMGGLNLPFISIYTPSYLQKRGDPVAYAESRIAIVSDICSTYPDKFQIASGPDDAEAYFKKGIMAFALGMENGAPLLNLELVKHFYLLGIRYVTLTHFKDNLICDSATDKSRTHNGLSAYGAEVVQEMNRLGIMIDVSHVSDSAFYAIMELSCAPVIASHSACRYFTPHFERNMSDQMIKKMASKGGVILINFGSMFLIQNKNQRVNASVENVVEQIEHVINLVGIDHVGFGSDFDGVKGLPKGLKDVSMYPNIIYYLMKRGYLEDEIEKICYKNIFRVWREVEMLANEFKSN